ncbi:hypothetical protein M1583_02590 [Candidatus Marsarchaeota archaeon]|nr:hypothetical protein [Candidatus Marsarchaeota archaeon]
MYGYSIGISVISIMLAAGGIIFGLGYAFDNRKLKDFGRGELIESIINAAILVAIIAIFMPGGMVTGITNSIAYGITGNACTGSVNYSYPICFAENYLVGLSSVSIGGQSYPSLLELSSASLLSISGLYAVAGLVSSLHLSIGVASISFSSLFKPFLMQLGDIIELLTLSLFSILLQYSVIKVISYVAVPVLLPIGMVLRTLYFTRRLGGAIMAIAISLFIILPMSYILDASIVQNYSQTSTAQFVSATESSLHQLYGSNSSKSGNYTSTGLDTVISDASSVISTAENSLLSIFRGIVIIVVEVIILPIFSLILTAISAREFARILGTEVTFSKFDVF